MGQIKSSSLTKADFVQARRGDEEFWTRMTDVKEVVNTEISPDDIATDSTHRFVTDEQIAMWNSGSGGSSTIAFLATTNIDAYAPVTSTGVYADSSQVGLRGKVIGINTANVLSGFMGAATGSGTISNSGWSWTIGDKIYLNGTSLSTTIPGTGFIQQIGTATASDTIDVNLSEPIRL